MRCASRLPGSDDSPWAWRFRTATWAALAGLALALLTASAAGADYESRAGAIAAYEQAQRDVAVPSGWTGSIASCDPGTESAASLNATLSTLNILRGFARVPPVALNPELNRRALAAALIMDAQKDLDHEPPESWRCWTETGRDAAATSSLGLFSGAEAMIGYIDDEDFDHDWNSVAGDLGHRRDLLNPATSERGTGSTGGANALHGSYENLRPVAADSIVAWPAPGWFPQPWIFEDWSVSIGRDQWEVPAEDRISVSGAKLAVRVDGNRVPTSNFRRLDRDYDHGVGASMGWRVALPAGFANADRVIEVSITGVTKGGEAFPIDYTVNAFTLRPKSAAPPGLRVRAVSRKGRSIRSVVGLDPEAEGRVRAVLTRLGSGKREVRRSTRRHTVGTGRVGFNQRLQRGKFRLEVAFLPDEGWARAARCVRGNASKNGSVRLRRC